MKLKHVVVKERNDTGLSKLLFEFPTGLSMGRDEFKAPVIVSLEISTLFSLSKDTDRFTIANVRHRHSESSGV